MPSLYEATAALGDVSSSDFTTLYNASGLTVPNAGAGAVTGNLNVSGNLTVQGTSNLIGAVTLGNTLSLPNYTFPLPDGSTDQVLVTNGSGILYWANVQDIPGAAYNISATTATGGANLTLSDNDGGTDSVKFASGTNITVSRTDANTITISSTADDIPDGTANGQVLVWESGAWTANNVVSATTSAFLTAEFKSNSTTTAGSFGIRRNTGSVAYTSGTSASLLAQVDSDSQAVATFGSVGFGYDASNPSFGVRTSTNNFATNTRILGADSTELVINGTNITLNDNLTGAPSSNATITVNRGSSTDAVITWDETDDRWELNNDLLATGLQGGNVQIAMGGASDNQIYIGGDDLQIDTDGSHVVISNSPIKTTAESMTINSDSTAADSFLYMKGSTEYLKWNNTDTRFELSDQLFISQTDVPAQFERQTTTAVTSQNEMPNSLRLTERVTDAGSNATDNGGTCILFGRTSGASGGAEKIYGLMGSRYYGTTNTADLSFQWSSDNFTETSPGVYPNTYQLLRLGSSDAEFFNNSLYIDYTTAGATQVGINTDTPAYTLDVDGDIHATGNVITGGITAGNITVGVVTDNEISTTSGDLTIVPASGSTVTIASSVATDPVTIARLTTVTNTATRGLTLRANSTGTPAVGFGVGLDFEVETAVSTFTSGGNIRVVSTDVTPASEDFEMEFSLTANGTQNVVATLDNTGTLDLDGDIQVNGNDIKSSTGSTAITLDNNSVVVQGDITVNGQEIKSNGGTTVITLSGANATVAGDLTVNGGDITLNASATITSIQMGSLSTQATNQVTTSATGATTIMFTTRNVMKVLVNVYDTITGDFHTVECLVLRNGATAMLTTYAELYTSAALATFTADVSGSAIRLLANPVSSNTTNFNCVRTSLT